MLTIFLTAVLIISEAPLLAASPIRQEAAGNEVLERYLALSESQKQYLRGAEMEVDIVGTLPAVNKSGKLRAFRYISKLGEITYRVITFQGDNTVKKDVIARYMSAETEAVKHPGLGVTAQNYRFKHYGVHGSGDWKLHVFRVTPRKKSQGLFEGLIWIHERTALPVREQGRLVKSPSVFLKRVAFVRDYRIQDGFAIPSHVTSSIETRIIGRAELEITFKNFNRQASANAGDQQVASLTGGGF